MLSVSDADVKAILAKQIKFTQDQKLPLIPPETGDYEQLYFDASKVKGYDDVQAYLKTGEVPKDIVDLMMKRVRDQLESQDVGIELTDSAKDLLAEQGYDPSLGARPLRRAIQRLIEDPLSEKILVVKSTIHYRAAFEPIAKEIIEVDAPGLSSSNLARFDFRRIRRPIFPLDPELEYEAE